MLMPGEKVCSFCNKVIPIGESKQFQIMGIHEDCYEKNAVKVRGIRIATKH